ncbi:hypothetical protein H6G33_10635 [Calothrix sp. FACHB-1219]|uniref:LAGLIDADG family homing endonuclease n=1 Tax=unclassified Calothrix TaxID=2619626 RepID=UPI001685D611|nr:MULTISPECIES: LAGLIDADG family homing endonuclease [unclassified Calothrix]MBD2201804.1 hypothetical protein [Calothrix sp. FACHB-168]MBD2217490.1 hypothetical protein [Calothrix sp. FACHB-1219]
MANYKKDFSLDSLFNDLISEGISSLESSADISIVEFAEEILFNSKVKLYPTQRAILKAFYGEPLEEDEILILNSWGDNDRTTWLPGRKYRNLVLEAGRRSGKTVLVSIIVLLEFYKLITLNNPAEYYKLLPGSPIAVFVISQSAEQVKETLFASIRGYAEGSDYFKSLEKAGKIEILTDEIRCRHKNIGIYAKHTNSKSLVGYSLKCLILDEVARFEYDEFGNSKADHLWENIGRGCQYKDDLIYTSICSITHKELLERYGEGIDILTLDPNTYTPYFTSNYSIKSNGIQDIYTLKTRTGLEGNYTDNHPFLVWRQDNNQPQWIELKDIQIGDRLAILTTVPYQGTNNSISKEKARLLGYLIGDGGISQNHIKFTNVSKEIIDDFQSILDKEYPGYKLVNYSKSKSYDYTVKSLGTSQPNLLKQWLRELGLMGKTSYTKFIPPDIISSSNDVLAEFIKGLFATDGYITNSKNIGIGLTNKNLIISLQRELLRFNVFSNVRLKNNKYFSTNTFNGKVSYVLEIRDKENILNFYTNIGLIPSKEQRQLDLLEIVLERKDKSKNGLSLLPLGLTKRFKEYKINNDLSWSDLLGRGYGGIRDNHCMSLSLLKGIDIKDDLIKYLVNSSIRWDEVKSVDYFKQDETIALSIPDTNIIGNPIISHNTITFGAEGHKIAISSAWEPGDYIEKLYEEVAIRDSSTLGLRLRTWDVNLNPNMSEESIKSSEDYIKDPISAATEYEGIRVLKQGTFMVIPNVKESFKGISSVDGRQVPIDTTNELGETRYYVGVKLSRVEPLTIGNSFAHVDYGVKKDSAALAICNPILIDNTWGIIVSTLLVWKPYIDRDKNNKGIQRIVSFLDMEEKLIELCKARRVMTCSFDSYNSQHAIQKLHLEGINTVEMSTSNANQLLYYSTTKTLIDQRLLILPRDSQWSPTLEYELCNLVQLPNGRVDHPKGSEHGKDTADAIANAIYNCYLYMIQSGLTSNIHVPVNAVHSNHLVGTSSSNRKHISRREGINKLKQFKSI